MFLDKRIAVVGHGAMGEAFVVGLIKREVVSPSQIIVSGR